MDRLSQIAKMIDHSLLHPTLTDRELEEGCDIALKYNVASVCIKPYAVPQAVRRLKGSDVRVGTVIGFPHGNSATRIKTEESLQAIEDGAAEIDMVVNIGKVLGEAWDYVEKEIKSVLDACHDHGAILKVIFENDFLPDPKFKIRLCEIASRVRVDFVKTSTGYGFVKEESGKYSYRGATIDDLKLMRKHCAPHVQIKAAGGIRTLHTLLAVRELGVTRVGASATVDILETARKKYLGA
jgi:deoxyribose-phosphate aldolase